MKVRVDSERCMGHAMCHAYAPDIFDVDDTGTNTMGEFEVPDQSYQAVLRGVRACPEGAISVVESPSPANQTAMPRGHEGG
jgi:ferredoxin